MRTPSSLPEVSGLLRRVENLDDVDLDKARESAVKWARQGARRIKRGVDKYGLAAKTVLGASLLFHGGEVGTCLLFAQTFRQSGLPSLREAGRELAERFESVSDAIEAEAPTLRKTKAALHKLEREADDVKQVFAKAAAEFEAGRMNKKDFQKAAAKLRRETAELSQAAARAAAGSSSIAHLVEALDPDAIKRALNSAWQSLLACVAVATKPAAGKISLGLAVGEDIGAAARSAVVPLAEQLQGGGAARGGRAALDEVRKAQGRLPPALRAWSQGAVTGLTQAGMVFAAFKRRQLVLTLSSAALGARVVLDGVRAAFRDRLPPLLEDDGPAWAAAHAGLTALGFAAQVKTQLALVPLLGKGRVPSPLRWPLRPAFLAEASLKALSAKNIAAAMK